MGTSIELGEYELDLTRGLLLRAGVKVPIRPKCFAVLLYLIRAYPRAVSIAELRTNVWKVQVGDGAIRDVILDIRRCLGDQGPPWRWIDGSPGIGYWLCESPSAPRSVAAALDPARVRATVSRRSSECQELLRAACVVGLEPRTRVLQLMLGWAMGPLLAALDEAKRFDLILPAAAPDTHRFADPVAKEALYAGLGAEVRMELHLRAGEALEATLASEDPQRLGVLAYHFGRAAPVGGAERAVLFGREAAARALRVAAFAEAASLLEGALQAFEHLPARDPLLRAE
jgi:DNA-binding winged helix-turn-helix (wHTH) protein